MKHICPDTTNLPLLAMRWWAETKYLGIDRGICDLPRTSSLKQATPENRCRPEPIQRVLDVCMVGVWSAAI